MGKTWLCDYGSCGYGQVAGSFEHSNKPLGYINCTEFPNYKNNY